MALYDFRCHVEGRAIHVPRHVAATRVQQLTQAKVCRGRGRAGGAGVEAGGGVVSMCGQYVCEHKTALGLGFGV